MTWTKPATIATVREGYERHRQRTAGVRAKAVTLEDYANAISRCYVFPRDNGPWRKTPEEAQGVWDRLIADSGMEKMKP